MMEPDEPSEGSSAEEICSSRTGNNNRNPERTSRISELDKRMGSLMADSRLEIDVTWDQIQNSDKIEELREQCFALHRRNEMIKIQSEILDYSRNDERKELDQWKSYKTTITQLTDLLENELSCSVCSEIFIEPKVLHCGHTYCKLCISDLLKANVIQGHCPLCRKTFWSKDPLKQVELTNFLEKIHDFLPPDIKTKREEIIQTRNLAAANAPPNVNPSSLQYQNAMRNEQFHRMLQLSRHQAALRQQQQQNPNQNQGHGSQAQLASGSRVFSTSFGNGFTATFTRRAPTTGTSGVIPSNTNSAAAATPTGVNLTRRPTTTQPTDPLSLLPVTSFSPFIPAAADDQTTPTLLVSHFGSQGTFRRIDGDIRDIDLGQGIPGSSNGPGTSSGSDNNSEGFRRAVVQSATLRLNNIRGASTSTPASTSAGSGDNSNASSVSPAETRRFPAPPAVELFLRARARPRSYMSPAGSIPPRSAIQPTVIQSANQSPSGSGNGPRVIMRVMDGRLRPVQGSASAPVSPISTYASMSLPPLITLTTSAGSGSSGTNAGTASVSNLVFRPASASVVHISNNYRANGGFPFSGNLNYAGSRSVSGNSSSFASAVATTSNSIPIMSASQQNQTQSQEGPATVPDVNTSARSVGDASSSNSAAEVPVASSSRGQSASGNGSGLPQSGKLVRSRGKRWRDVCRSSRSTVVPSLKLRRKESEEGNSSWYATGDGGNEDSTDDDEDQDDGPSPTRARLSPPEIFKGGRGSSRGLKVLPTQTQAQGTSGAGKITLRRKSISNSGESVTVTASSVSPSSATTSSSGSQGSKSIAGCSTSGGKSTSVTGTVNGASSSQGSTTDEYFKIVDQYCCSKLSSPSAAPATTPPNATPSSSSGLYDANILAELNQLDSQFATTTVPTVSVISVSAPVNNNNNNASGSSAAASKPIVPAPTSTRSESEQ